MENIKAQVLNDERKTVDAPSGFVHIFRNKFPGLFQDFSRAQIDFSRTLKFTLILSLP